MCPVRPAPKAVIRAPAQTFETPKELLGIVAGEPLAVERFEQLDDVGDREHRCRLRPHGRRRPASTPAGPTVGRLRAVRVRERQDGSSTTLLLVAGGRERNYG